MAKQNSEWRELVGRAVKGVVGALLIPPVVGVGTGLLAELNRIYAADRKVGYWFLWGFIGYVTMHVLLARPRGLFGLNHAILARLATWLFGGQVTTVGADGASGSAAAKASSRTKRGRRGRGKGGDEADAEHASTLVVISPYLVPLYVILVCLAAAVVTKIATGPVLQAAIGVLLGVAISFHIAMTGEDLQEHGEQFPIETRLMALTVSLLASVAITAACIPLALPSFSTGTVFERMSSVTLDIYGSIFRALFSPTPPA